MSSPISGLTVANFRATPTRIGCVSGRNQRYQRIKQSPINKNPRSGTLQSQLDLWHSSTCCDGRCQQINISPRMRFRRSGGKEANDWIKQSRAKRWQFRSWKAYDTKPWTSQGDHLRPSRAFSSLSRPMAPLRLETKGMLPLPLTQARSDLPSGLVRQSPSGLRRLPCFRRYRR